MKRNGGKLTVTFKCSTYQDPKQHQINSMEEAIVYASDRQRWRDTFRLQEGEARPRPRTQR